MGTSREQIAAWFDRGVQQGAAYMIVVCDTFDYDDYPAYVKPAEDVHEQVEHYRNASMQRVMEVYDLSANMAEQLAENRCFRLPARTLSP